MNVYEILDKFEELSYQFRDEATICENNIKTIEANPLIVEKWKNRAELWIEVSDYLKKFVDDLRKNI